MKNEKVLILDGETRSALATVRSLGKKGFACIVGSCDLPSLAGTSKYCAGTLKYPSISKTPKEFKVWLLDLLAKTHFDHILPVSDSSITALLDCRNYLPESLNFPFPKTESILIAQDKFKIIDLAKEHGICVPKTILIKDNENSNIELKDFLIENLGLPIVFKAQLSIQNTEDGLQEKPPLKYAKTPAEVESFLESNLRKKYSYIAQEYIKGDGTGLFLLMRNSLCTASFSHKRILEKPPEGGVSVLSEAIESPESLTKTAIKLLQTLNWEGVAMLEFKSTNKVPHVLMEINPRLWGSLQLSIDSGIDFPALLLEKPPTAYEQNNYKVKNRLRWELGLLDHTLILLKRNFLETLKKVFIENYLQFFSRNTKNEIIRRDDLNPFLHELIKYRLKQ